MAELVPREPISTSAAPERGLLEWLVKPAPGRWLLPLTGLWILGLDWLIFSQNAMSLGVATPVAIAVGFLVGTIGAYVFQRRFGTDTRPAAWLKALMAGVIVGVPLPLAGTLVGGWVLVASGLGSIKDRLRRR